MSTNITELVKQYEEKAKALKKTNEKILIVMLVPLVTRLILEIKIYILQIKVALLLADMTN